MGITISKMTERNTIGTSETITKTKENGTTNITRIRSTWNNISVRNRRIMIAYGVIGCVYTAIEAYAEGKKSLLEYRARTTVYSANAEWNAVRKGCSEGACRGSFDAIIWPFRIGSQLMPHVILMLNPPPRSI
jgi:hypothetical protein